MVNDIESLNKVWREVLSGEIQTWVIFENGTCVICRDVNRNPKEYATDLMKTMGIVIPGSSHGDFRVRTLDNIPGWIVEYHHEDIFSYVHPSEIEGPDSGNLEVGLHGRSMRGKDAQDLVIIHVERR